jgi:dimethylargininase
LSLFDFDRAIVRAPARSVTDGLRAGDHDGPSYEAVAAEHSAYIAALESAGLAVEILPALEAYPDSMFVEDPALVFSQGAILLRPGAKSRIGEAKLLRSALEPHFAELIEIKDGHADGGDILVTAEKVLIGLSDRTDLRGAQSVARGLGQLGLRARLVETPDDVLHFKTACAMLDEETVVVTTALDNADIFGDLRRILIPEGEEAAANLLRLNDVVLIGAEFPRTRELVEGLGFSTMPLAVAEIGKIDAGLSCMSLRWKAMEEQG